MQNNPISAFSYLLEGFKLLNRKGLKRYVYIPLVINIVIFAAIFRVAAYYFGDLTHWIDSLLPGWLQWLNWILWPLFVLTAGTFLIYTFVIFANLVAAPFNGLLSEKVETLVIGDKVDQGGGIIEDIKDVPRAIKRQIDVIIYFVPRSIVLLLLFLIPGVNIIASGLWFLFGCWTMSMQYIDYPMDNHKVAFPQMRQAMREKNWTHLAFGITVTIAMMIPVVNFFAMPAAVIGATLMWKDIHSG